MAQPTPRRTWADLRLVLATDLDNTLIGDAAALARLQAMLSRRRDRVGLIYLTGRSRDSALTLLAAAGALAPDVLVSDVGTAIGFGPAYAPDPQWTALLAPRWNRQGVLRAAAGCAGLIGQDIAAPLRCSFHMGDAPATTLRQLSRRLAAAGLDCRLVLSSGCDLDVLPRGAGKGAALCYLQARLVLPAGAVLVAGDSGNDLDMLQLGYHSVVVGGCRPELAGALPPGVRRARGRAAAGILEALYHFGLAPT